MGGSSNTTTSGGKDKDKGGKDSPAAFMEGDRVLAYHGPLLYEAKVHFPHYFSPSIQLRSVSRVGVATAAMPTPRRFYFLFAFVPLRLGFGVEEVRV